MTSRTIALAAAMCAGLLAALPAGAEEKPQGQLIQDGGVLHFDAAGHRFSLPLPDWLTAAERLSTDVVGLVESNIYADPMQAFVEFFPKGQSLADWTTTYAARVTLEPGRSLEDYRRAAIYGYSQPCKPEATGAFYFGEETADFFPALGFVCAAYRDDLPKLRGKGEVIVSVFRKTKSGIAVIYQEWKGPAFDPSDVGTWPVSREQLLARAEELQRNATFIAAAD